MNDKIEAHLALVEKYAHAKVATNWQAVEASAIALAAPTAPTEPVAVGEREQFEAWWEQFAAEHEEWRFADSHALRWQAWQARALASPSDAERLDAARYVWLKKYLISDSTEHDDAIINAVAQDEFDAAIDAALATKGGKL